MRQTRSHSFGSHLSKAIKSIARTRPTTIPALEQEISAGMRELGYPMSNYTVNGWRRGYLPDDPEQFVWLVRWCLKQGYKDQQTLKKLAEFGPDPQQAALLQELFPAADLDQPLASAVVAFLPPRPRYLYGRAKEVSSLRRALEEPGSALAITGLPGMGKSALVAEVGHQLVSDSSGGRIFPDGIFFFFGQDLQGPNGLDMLVKNLLTCFQEEVSDSSSLRFRALRALAGKRALFVLDDVQPDFPLDQALEVLLAHSRRWGMDESEVSSCKVLITSRAIPQSSHLTFHLSLEPLEAPSARKLLRQLIESTNDLTTESAERLCAAVGHLPLAIELAAHAINLDSQLIPILCQQPLRIDTQGELSNRFALLIGTLPAETQQRFARLAPLETAPFSLSQAAALMQLPELHDEESIRAAGAIHHLVGEDGQPALEIPEQALAAAALDLVQLKQASLLHVLPSPGASRRYQIPPISQAVNAEILRLNYLQTVSYARQFQGDLLQLLENKDRLLTAVTHAWVASSYAQVVDLVECMYFLFGRMPFTISKEILRWGIVASQNLNESYYRVRFINRLGRLRFYRGDYQTARQEYEESIEILDPLIRTHRMRSNPFLLPWVNLYTLHYYDGELEASQRAVQAYLDLSMDSGDVSKVTSGYIKLACLAWAHGDLDRAASELQKTTGLLDSEHSQSGHVPVNLEGDLFWARISNNYEEAQRLSAQTFDAMQRETLDDYWLGDIRLDEAHFAFSQSRFSDARRFALEGLHYAANANAPVLAARFQRQLALIPN